MKSTNGVVRDRFRHRRIRQIEVDNKFTRLDVICREISTRQDSLEKSMLEWLRLTVVEDLTRTATAGSGSPPGLSRCLAVAIVAIQHIAVVLPLDYTTCEMRQAITLTIASQQSSRHSREATMFPLPSRPQNRLLLPQTTDLSYNLFTDGQVRSYRSQRRTFVSFAARW